MSTNAENTLEVGLAFAQIRDERLHRVQFANFEAYWQAKWAYGRRYVNQLISAAQLVKHLGAISSLQKPDHETPVRPLVGLTPDQAQTAWERAVEKPGGHKITARLVKAAMQDLQVAPKVPASVSKIRRANRAERRQLVDDTFQVLFLLSQQANHTVLTEKVETLHRQIPARFAET